MDKTIIFYSPLNANIPFYKTGGAEIGCKRTIEILKKIGYKVEMIAKPTGTAGVKGYITEAVQSLREVRSKLRGSDAELFYLVGFYEKNIYIEWLISFWAKRSNKKIIYEPKNGCMVSDYYKGNAIYRYFNKKVLRRADAVFCQGIEYVRFLKEEFDIEGVYLPNYVMDKYLEASVERKQEEMIHLVFTGRIAPEKNVNLMIEVSKRLSELGINNDLTLIGAYTEEYKRKLDQIISKLGIKKGQIQFLGSMTQDSILEELRKKDFFIFPSTNRTEGHSNALTEAMACGVIPIASTAGFNRDVIGNGKLIVQEMEADKYAECIADILKNDDVESLRHEMIQRVKNNFTESIATEKMRRVLDKLHRNMAVKSE